MNFPIDIKTFTYNKLPFEDCDAANITILYGDFTNSCKGWISEVFSDLDMESSKANDSQKGDPWLKFLLSLTHAVQSDHDFIKRYADQLTTILPFIFYDRKFFNKDSNSSNSGKKAIKNVADLWNRMVVLCSYSHSLKKNISRSDAQGILVEKNEIKDLQDEIKQKISDLYAQHYNALYFDKNKVIVKKPTMTAALANLPNQNTLFIPVLPSLYALHAMTVLLNGKVGKKQDLFSLEFKNDSLHFPWDAFQIRYSTRKLLNKVKSDLSDTLRSIYQPISPQKEHPIYSEWFFRKSLVPATNEKHLFFKSMNFRVPICKIRKVANEIMKCCGLNSNSHIALLKELPNLLYCVGRGKKHKEIIASIAENQESAHKIDEIVSILRKFCDINFYLKETREDFIQESSKLIDKLAAKDKGVKTSSEEDSTNVDSAKQAKKVSEFLNKFFVFKDINRDILTCYGLNLLPLMEVEEYSGPVKKLGNELKRLLKNKDYKLVCPIEDKNIQKEDKIKSYFLNSKHDISESIFRYMSLENALELIDTYGSTRENQATKPSESVALGLLKGYLAERKIKLNKYVIKESFPLLSKRALEIFGNSCLSMFYQAALHTFGFYDA